MDAEFRVYDSAVAWRQSAAEHFTNIAEAAITTRGRFSVALAGGNTPRGLYRLLGSMQFNNYIDWQRVRIFFGDERCVPPSHEDSNYKMVRDTLLDYVPILPDHIFRIQGENPPEEAAKHYDQTLRRMFRRQTGMLNEPQPRFDLVILGMGSDGHTASLFPKTDALNEDLRWSVANYVEKLDTWRVTLTVPAINAASNIMFIVMGEDKADALAQVLEGPHNPIIYPSQFIKPTNGKMFWMVDKAAASKLKNHG